MLRIFNLITDQLDILDPLKKHAVFDQSAPDLQKFSSMIDELFCLQRAFPTSQNFNLPLFVYSREKRIASAVQRLEIVLRARSHTDSFLTSEIVLIDYLEVALVRFCSLILVRVKDDVVIRETAAHMMTLRSVLLARLNQPELLNRCLHGSQTSANCTKGDLCVKLYD